VLITRRSFRLGPRIESGERRLGRGRDRGGGEGDEGGSGGAVHAVREGVMNARAMLKEMGSQDPAKWIRPGHDETSIVADSLIPIVV